MDVHTTGTTRATATDTLTFPPGFRWGVATSSYQYEGFCENSQWYAWEQTGHIKTGDSAGIACDWWHHAERDFDLAQQLGLNALRLSLEWSRLEPRPSEWDAAAFARYREMLQGLRARGIEPMVTLHHFSNPIWFEERGAFLAPDAVAIFARFVERVIEELGDLCDLWCTINEPNVYSVVGYLIGVWPPGHHGDIRSAFKVLATLAHAHAAAYHVIHQRQPQARVGWAQNFNILDPATSSPLDRFIARVQDSAYNDFFPRVVMTGRAPFPFNLFMGNVRAVRGTCDFLGINLYYRERVAFDLRYPGDFFGHRYTPEGAPRGDTGINDFFGEVYPAGILRIAQQLAIFGKPLYITEHGVADRADRIRPWVVEQGARNVHAAIQQGSDVRGYYHWSLVDNFEWADGWRMRFGLAALDIATQERTLRPSAWFYSAIASANALTPDMVRQHVTGHSGE
ncbi:MAG TPA: family 1 glycosylhydrolase [Ktedonobacterales bacterium]|nr:family 1 glycosylhydrolase [Ktedonobacterales bacterium]